VSLNGKGSGADSRSDSYIQGYPQVVPTSYSDYNMNNSAIPSNCAPYNQEFVYTDMGQVDIPFMMIF